MKTSLLPRKIKEELQRVKRGFVQQSLEHLLKLESRALKRGMPIDQLHTILSLPYWLVVARRKIEGAPAKLERGPRTTVEEADEIQKLYLQGLTYYAILQRMGWASVCRVKKIVRDRKLSR